MKKITRLEIYKSLRKTWGINPETRVVPNKKKNSRNKDKSDFKKYLKEEGY